MYQYHHVQTKFTQSKINLVSSLVKFTLKFERKEDPDPLTSDLTMSQNWSSSSRENFFSSEEFKDYQVELELFSTEEHDVHQVSSVKKKRGLAESMVRSSIRDLQNCLTSLRSSFRELSVTQFQEFYQKQQEEKLDPEEFGCRNFESVLKQLALKKKCLLVEHKVGRIRIFTEVKDCDIVTDEILEKNEEEQKLLKVGHQGLFRVSLLEKKCVTEVWIHHLSHQAKRIKLEEEMSQFYECPPLHYQVQSQSQCEVGRLLAARYDQMVVRVVVQKVLLDETTIKVRHVDYGTTQDVDIHELFFLDRKFLSYPALVSKVEF